jgi:hypothetical protein
MTEDSARQKRPLTGVLLHGGGFYSQLPEVSDSLHDNRMHNFRRERSDVEHQAARGGAPPAIFNGYRSKQSARRSVIAEVLL